MSKVQPLKAMRAVREPGKRMRSRLLDAAVGGDRAALARLLSMVERGGDGARAVAVALEWRPRAILLDIQLPGMDGYAVAAALKEQAELAGVPIIAVTSHAMAGDRQRILAAGADGSIEKPIDPATFVAEICRYLDK